MSFFWNNYLEDENNYKRDRWCKRRYHPVLNTIIIIVALLVVGIRYLFFDSVQRLECLPDLGCTLYVKNNRVSPEYVDRKFNPKDILNYEYVTHRRSSGSKHNRHYYNVYTLLLHMKDGTNIHLQDFERRDKETLVNLINDMWYNKEVRLP